MTTQTTEIPSGDDQKGATSLTGGRPTSLATNREKTLTEIVREKEQMGLYDQAACTKDDSLIVWELLQCARREWLQAKDTVDQKLKALHRFEVLRYGMVITND